MRKGCKASTGVNTLPQLQLKRSPPCVWVCALLSLAATIGNWIGGAICMATVYAFIYGRPPKQFFAWLEERLLQRRQQVQVRLKLQQQKAPHVEVRAPITLDADAEVSFATARLAT